MVGMLSASLREKLSLEIAIFLDCSSEGECLPGQLDVQSSAVSVREGRIHKAVTGGWKLKGTSYKWFAESQTARLTAGEKLKNSVSCEGFCFPETMETFLMLCTVLNIILTPDFMTYAFIT